MTTDYILGAPRRLLSGTVVVLICSIPAFAGSIVFTGSYGVAYNYYSSVPHETSIESSSGLTQPPLPSLPLTVSNSGSGMGLCCGASQSGEFSISSSYGSLSASSSANAYGIDGEGAGVTIGSDIGGGVGYQGAGMALFEDELGITSSTLGNGAPVSLTLDFSYTGNSSFMSDCCEGSDANVGAYYTLFGQNVLFEGNGTFSQSVTINTDVGAIIMILGQLDASGDADSGDGYGGASSFSATASSSMNITGITNGACLVTQSGADYGQAAICGNASAAPEPSTVTLVGTVALVLLAARRKRHWA